MEDNIITLENIEKLKQSTESSLSRKIVSSSDFERLSDAVFKKTNVLISPTTLKRIWGYIKDGSSPRISTLSAIAAFLGYNDFHDFLKSHAEQDESLILAMPTALEASCMDKGDRIEISWIPDRRCLAEYLGNNMFQVIEARNSKIGAGCLFRCSMFIEKAPLYTEVVDRETGHCSTYIAGSRHGIRFRIKDMKKESNGKI